MSTALLRFGLLLALILSSSGSWAEELAGTGSEPFIPEDLWDKPAPVSRDSQMDMAGTAGRMAMSLLFLIACLIVGLVMLKRWNRGRQMLRPSRHMELVESLPLGMKRSLVLVRLGDQVLVVGQTDQQVSHVATVPADVLKELEKEGTDVADRAPSPSADPTAAASPAKTAGDKLGRFQEKLQALLGGKS